MTSGSGAPAIAPSGKLELSANEDAPMCMAVNAEHSDLVCGINTPAGSLKDSANELIRVFHYSAAGKEEAASEVTISATAKSCSLAVVDAEHYIKACAFSPDGQLLAVGSTDGRTQLRRYPSLETVWKGERSLFDASETVYDVDFSYDSTQVVFTTAAKVIVASTAPRTADGKTSDEPRILQTISSPAVGASQRGTFRAAKFGRSADAGTSAESISTRNTLYTVINTPGSGRGKNRERCVSRRHGADHSYICMWDADTWQLRRTRRVAMRPSTVLAMRCVHTSAAADPSPDGKLLACGASDLSVTVLNGMSLRVRYAAGVR